MCVRVVAATFYESGASLSTIETVDTAKPQARATSNSVTWPDLRWATFLSLPNVRKFYAILTHEHEPRLASANIAHGYFAYI